MKTLTLIIFAVLPVYFYGCSVAEWHPETKPETDIPEVSNNSMPDDSLILNIEILNSIEIGWGTKYSCSIKKVLLGNPENIDSVFIMSACVGSEGIYDNIHLLGLHTNYTVLFVKSERKSAETYIPAGTTGFMDRDSMIWDMILIERN